MSEGDFYGSEKSAVLDSAGELKIELLQKDGGHTVLKDKLAVLAGEVIDGATMSSRRLREFIASEIEDAKQRDVLFSLHLKATMMKVSDPIMFGIVVSEFYGEVLEKHAELLDKVGVDRNNGIGDLYSAIQSLPSEQQDAINADIEALYKQRPQLAMVNSDKGITNLHVPSDVIIDASMPAMIRDSGKMWGADDELHDTKAVIPDRCYAGIYQIVIEFCKQHGAFDPTTMGSVPNVGLMAQKAEEYGSHDKTFEIPADGTVRVVDEQRPGAVRARGRARGHLADVPDQGRADPGLGQAGGDPGPRQRHAGDLLAGSEARPRRPADREGRALPEGSRHRRAGYPDHDAGRRHALHAGAYPQGQGHHLGHRQRAARLPHRPVPDPGARHQRQDAVDRAAAGRRRPVRDRCRRLGAQARPAVRRGRPSALGFAGRIPGPGGVARAPRQDLRQRPRHGAGRRRLDKANGQFLDSDKSPKRKVGELDNRGSHFYLALYWAEALAEQDDDAELKGLFSKLTEVLKAQEQTIIDELNQVQGQPVDIQGYFHPDYQLTREAMRPSATFNKALEEIVKN